MIIIHIRHVTNLRHKHLEQMISISSQSTEIFANDHWHKSTRTGVPLGVSKYVSFKFQLYLLFTYIQMLYSYVPCTRGSQDENVGGREIGVESTISIQYT